MSEDEANALAEPIRRLGEIARVHGEAHLLDVAYLRRRVSRDAVAELHRALVEVWRGRGH